MKNLPTEIQHTKPQVEDIVTAPVGLQRKTIPSRLRCDLKSTKLQAPSASKTGQAV